VEAEAVPTNGHLHLIAERRTPMANPLKAVRALALAAALLAVPIVVDTSPASQGSVLRFASACAAEECEKDDDYACLLGELPLVGYKCSRGCADPPGT